MVKVYKTKILLLLTMLLAVCQVKASEVVIYTGPTSTGSWSGYAQISADAFTSAKVGDIVKVYTSNVEEGAQGSFKDGSTWGAIADGYEYFEISGDFTMTITDEILEKLKASGLIVGGQKYTIESVVIVTAKTATTTETEIFAGPKDTGSWSGYAQIAAGAFANAKVGDIVKVYTSNVEEGAQGSFKDGATWGAIADGYEYFEISGDFMMTITDEILEKLKANGLIVGGQKYTIESVVIITEESGEKQINADLFPIANNDDVEVYDATFDATTKTIDFQEYGIAGWSWNPSHDMSMYESVTIELAEKTTTSITVQISYVNKASAEYVEIAAGKKKIEFELNGDYADAVESVYLYPTNSEAASITISTVYGTLKPGMVDGIEESIASDTESSVLSRTYYNMAGQESFQMHKGLNIIRMQMSDGTIKVKKVIVK